MPLLHWIVATIGFHETLLLIAISCVGIFYVAWSRRFGIPKGIWRWGMFLPLVMSLEFTRGGIVAHWELYDMMMHAGAFNEPQKDLFVQQSVWGGIKMFSLGVIGTIFILKTVKGKAVTSRTP